MHIHSSVQSVSRAFLLASALAGAASAQPFPFTAPCAAWRPGETRAWATLAQALSMQSGATQSGEAVITEFMKDPSSVADTRGEWFEVYNALPWRLNVEGWTISDDAGSQHVINAGGAGVRCRPGHYLVLGNNGDISLNGGVHEDYVYSSFTLSNTADQIILTRPNGVVVDRVAYDSSMPWPSAAGKAISLRNAARTAADNDDGANWCLSSSALSGTNPDTGTPSLVNDACP